jgi:hypothetical protein
MTMREGVEVRLLQDAVSLEGNRVPAGIIGTIVDTTHAPGQYAVDVVVDGAYDDIAVT